MKLKLSFQGWVLGGCLVVVVCTLAFVGVFLERSLREDMVDHLRNSILQQLVILNEVLADRYYEGMPLEEADALAVYLGQTINRRVTLLAPNGTVVGDSEVLTEEISRLENHLNRPEITQAMKQGSGWSLRRSVTLGEDLLYVAGLLGTPRNPKLIVRVALSLAEVQKTLDRLKQLIFWSTILGVALSLGVAFLVARRISKPVRDLIGTVHEISAGNLTQRLRRYPNHEIGELGRAFDRMADHLQDEIDAVTRARDRLETILRSMLEGVLVTDQTGRITVANQALAELLDIRTNPIGRMPSEILRNAQLIDALRRVSPGSPYASSEIRTLTDPPRVLEVDIALLPGEGPRAGVVAVFHDITERKRLDEMRRDFVANVSHELRTPLAAIRASVETLLDGALSDPKFAMQFSQVIQRHVMRLEEIIVDLLELARLESTPSAIQYEETTANDLADACLNAVAELAANRQVTLTRDVPQPDLKVRGDRRQLEHAALNLLENAIKYTETGGRVTLGISAQQSTVVLEVRDTGIGIAAEHIPRIFERFYRVDKNRSRDLGGTGLGLSIVKHVAQAHNGRVDVTSQPGKGSTFRLIIPA